MGVEVAVPGAGGGRELATRVAVGAGLAGIAVGALVNVYLLFAVTTLAAALAFGEWLRLRTMPLRWNIPFGLLYVISPVVALVWLRSLPMGEWLVLSVFAVVWGGDIGAFAVGRVVRGPRLWPSISPAKTWAGLVGAVLGAMAMSGLVFLWMRVTAWSALEDSDAYRLAVHVNWAAIAGFALVGVGGDLFESMLKRRAGVKDSGTLLPGHGGVLDRIDSLIPVAPAVAGAVALGWL